MRLVIDTDPGIGSLGADPEDGLAILLALNSPEVTLEGITLVHGNVPISHSWPNARHLLRLAGRVEVPLHAGATGPRDPGRRALQAGWLAHRGHLERIVPAAEPPAATAVEFLTSTVAASPGEVTLVAIGPLTNVAAAIEADPGFAPALDRLVVMGGAATCNGNITPAAEFNVWMDPEAARIVFDSGAAITMVGLDVCHRTSFDRGRADLLGRSGSELGELAARCARSWIEVRDVADQGGGSLHLYDSLAVAAAIDPTLLGCEDALVEVETGDGPAQGMTVTHRNPLLRAMLTGREPNAAVALEVDTPRFTEAFDRRVTTAL